MHISRNLCMYNYVMPVLYTRLLNLNINQDDLIVMKMTCFVLSFKRKCAHAALNYSCTFHVWGSPRISCGTPSCSLCTRSPWWKSDADMLLIFQPSRQDLMFSANHSHVQRWHVSQTYHVHILCLLVTCRSKRWRGRWWCYYKPTRLPYGWPEPKLRHGIYIYIFFRTPGDVSSHFSSNITICFWGDLQIFPVISDATKSCISVRECGDQNRHFKPNHDVLV